MIVGACSEGSTGAATTTEKAPTGSTTTTRPPIEGTRFGFFPFPNGTEFSDVLAHFQDLADHGEVVLVQPEVPWEDFADDTPATDTTAMENVRNLTLLAGQNDLEPIFVVDPLNGLDRTSFIGLPATWPSTFSDPMVRASFTGFATWIADQFRPRYLGLGSEINTYLDAHPDDIDAFLDLYRTTRSAIKATSPATAVFVTFQWEVVNGLADGTLDPQSLDPQWEQIERFEPDLDLWVISSYPFVSFSSGADIPDDYYLPLVERTTKPLAVAESGYLSRPTGPFPGDPQSQVDQLRAIHDQIGSRLDFWINLVLDDFDPEAIADPMREQGRSERDIEGLGIFSSIGLRRFDETPKPALDLWQRYRAER